MTGKDKIAISVGKTVAMVSRAAGVGAGGTWPGELALRISPHFLSHISKNSKVILIAGTNGKTTTAKMLETILSYAGEKVSRNATGANLDNGVASAFISDAKMSGKLRSKVFIFEVDEASLPIILKSVEPAVVVLLNVFRDQLDRYGEVDTVLDKWKKALVQLQSKTTLVVNADDPHIAYIAQGLKANVVYFGLNDSSLYLPKMQHATDTIFCPKCGHRLTFGGVFFSHLGKWACGQCGFTHPENDRSARDDVSPMEGVYNRYNTLAAALTAKTLDVPEETIRNGLKEFTPAFGRMEDVSVGGKKVRILLSKNPTGFNESLRTFLASKSSGSLLIYLNDRVPDGRDVSWIWDVDFEVLAGSNRSIVVSGDRVWDMAVRLKYAGVESVDIEPDSALAIQKGLNLTADGQLLWILPTYSAMLDVRKIITGKQIL